MLETIRIAPTDFGFLNNRTVSHIPSGTASAVIHLDDEWIGIDATQAWFWTDEWKDAEIAIQADIDAGRIHRHANVEDAIAALGLEEDAGD